LNGIGVVVALPRELPAGFVRVACQECLKPWAVAVYRLMTGPGQHVAVQAGVGRVRAAAAAHLLIQRFSPRALASFGFAGGLVPELGRGTLVIGTAVVEAATGHTVAVADHDLAAQFYRAAVAKNLPVQRGIIVTSRHVVADPTAKTALSVRSGACAVDMESAGIAEAAHEAGLPWVAVRAIVDRAQESLPEACLNLLGEDGSIAPGGLLQTFCRSPTLLWHVLRLARHTATARRHLSQTFECWAASLTLQCAQEPE